MRAPPETIANARRLRRSLSPPEARLWSRLRARAPGTPVFRRQHPVGPYVLDFYCGKARLAVEIDGMSHDTADRPELDARKDAWLRRQGITVMRVPAGEVAHRIDDVADSIVRLAAELIETSPLHRASRGPPPPQAGRMRTAATDWPSIASGRWLPPLRSGEGNRPKDGEGGASLRPLAAQTRHHR
jgi:very-short-patch-repair endonuclease